MKQLGLAAQNYQSGNGNFPAGWQLPIPGPTTGNVWSNWTYAQTQLKADPAYPGAARYTNLLIELLPYIEQDALFKKYNQSVNWSDPLNLPVTSTRIKTYECPSSPSGQKQDGAPDTTPAWSNIVANTDYAGIYGVHPNLGAGAGGLNLVDAASVGITKGAISKTTGLRFADFTDGTSNTLFVTESAGRPDIYRNGKLAVAGSASARVNGGGWCRPASEIAFLLGTDAAGTAKGGSGFINVTNGIDYIAEGGPSSAFYGTDGTSQIYSFHSGGVNATLVDGSVRFISASTNIRTFARLVTRDGGEVNDLN